MILNVDRKPGLHRRVYALGLVIVLSLWGLISAEPLQPLAQSNAKLLRGVWYTSADRLGYLSPTVPQELQQIKNRLCPDYIQLAAFVYQATKNSSDPHIDPARTIPDEAFRRVISEVHRLGLRASLLIVLYVDDGTWEGAIRPQDANAWFEAWTRIVTHYAELGQELNLETLLIGSELETLSDRAELWMRLIGQVRRRYRGQVSYSTNFWVDRQEYQRVLNMRQWAQLDAIGVTAYFELTNKSNATLSELEAAWRSDRNGQNVLADLQALSERYQKPIQFWEIGYQSRDGTTIFPWDYRIVSPVDEQEQAQAYQALLNVYRGVPWFLGYGIYAQAVGLPKNPTGYDVLGKAAEQVFSCAR